MSVYLRAGEGVCHVDLWCAAGGRVASYEGDRLWRAPGGDEIRYRPNGRRVASCSRCLEDGAGLAPTPPMPSELARALAVDSTAIFVYDLRDPERLTAQVGSGHCGRVERRWQATMGWGRFGPDTIWWLYDMARDGRLERLSAALRGPFSKAESLRGERELREQLRREGWQVSSAV